MVDCVPNRWVGFWVWVGFVGTFYFGMQLVIGRFVMLDVGCDVGFMRLESGWFHGDEINVGKVESGKSVSCVTQPTLSGRNPSALIRHRDGYPSFFVTRTVPEGSRKEARNE